MHTTKFDGGPDFKHAVLIANGDWSGDIHVRAWREWTAKDEREERRRPDVDLKVLGDGRLIGIADPIVDELGALMFRAGVAAGKAKARDAVIAHAEGL